jgi:hypothetical protein
MLKVAIRAFPMFERISIGLWPKIGNRVERQNKKWFVGKIRELSVGISEKTDPL